MLCVRVRVCKCVCVCVCVCVLCVCVCLCTILLFLHSDDDNRIVLQPISGHSDCQKDYINASYIDVSIMNSNQYVNTSTE